MRAPLLATFMRVVMQRVVVQQAGPTVTGPCNKPFLAAARPPSRKCTTVSLRYRSATRSRFTTLEPVRETQEPAHYVEGSEYLKSLGFQHASEVARVLDIAMNPTSIYLQNKHKRRSVNISARKLSVQEDMVPVCQFFQSQGMSDEQIVVVVSRHPPVLSYSVDDRLKPFMAFLAEIGVPDPVHTVLQRPSLLGLDADKNLRSIVGYLQANDHTIESICHLLETSI